jgi:hypothetical protein
MATISVSRCFSVRVLTRRSIDHSGRGCKFSYHMSKIFRSERLGPLEAMVVMNGCEYPFVIILDNIGCEAARSCSEMEFSRN